MSKSKSDNKVRKLLKTSLGQGIMAFIVGGLGYILSQILVSLLGANLYEAFIGGQRGYHTQAVLGGPWLWVPTLTMIVISTAVAAALGASLVVVYMRWLGLTSKWPAAVQTVYLSSIMYVAIALIAFTGRTPVWHGVFVQTLIDYTSLLVLGLPFSLAWLYANRKKPVSRKKVK